MTKQNYFASFVASFQSWVTVTSHDDGCYTFCYLIQMMAAARQPCRRGIPNLCFYLTISLGSPLQYQRVITSGKFNYVICPSCKISEPVPTILMMLWVVKYFIVLWNH